MRFILTTAAALAIAACVPDAPGPEDRPGGGQIDRSPRPMKAPPRKPAPPPGVTVIHNPDGSLSVTIREPRCPNCTPWDFGG
jgi:hypothetical protein